MQSFPSLHEQLDSLRRLRKLTLAAIGQRMAIGKEQVSRLCSGSRDARVSSMQAAAESVQGVWVLVPEETYDSVRKVLDRHAAKRSGAPVASGESAAVPG